MMDKLCKRENQAREESRTNSRERLFTWRSRASFKTRGRKAKVTDWEKSLPTGLQVGNATVGPSPERPDWFRVTITRVSSSAQDARARGSGAFARGKKRPLGVKGNVKGFNKNPKWVYRNPNWDRSGILLLGGDIHPHPGPRKDPKRKYKLKAKNSHRWRIASENVNSIESAAHQEELTKKFSERNLDLVLVTEARLCDRKQRSMQASTHYHWVRPGVFIRRNYVFLYDGSVENALTCIAVRRKIYDSHTVEINTATSRLINIEMEMTGYGWTKSVEFFSFYSHQEQNRSGERPKAWAQLNEAVVRAKTKGNRIIVGTDTNGRMSPEVTEHYPRCFGTMILGRSGRATCEELNSDNNGQAFIDLVTNHGLAAASTFFYAPEIHTFADRRQQPARNRQLDYMVVDREIMKGVIKCHAKHTWKKPEMVMGHFPLLLDLNLRECENKRSTFRRKIKSSGATGKVLRYCRAKIQRACDYVAGMSEEQRDKHFLENWEVRLFDRVRSRIAEAGRTASSWDEMQGRVVAILEEEAPPDSMQDLCSEVIPSSAETLALMDKELSTERELSQLTGKIDLIEKGLIFKKWREYNRDGRKLRKRPAKDGFDSNVGSLQLEVAEKLRQRRLVKEQIRVAKEEDIEDFFEEQGRMIGLHGRESDKYEACYKLAHRLKGSAKFKARKPKKKSEKSVIKAEDFTRRLKKDFVETNQFEDSDAKFDGLIEKTPEALGEKGKHNMISKGTRDSLLRKPTVEELVTCIMNVSSHKALGLDQIGAEIFKMDPVMWAEFIIRMDLIAKPPESMQRGWVAWLYKDKGKRSDNMMYRPVAILSQMYKIIMAFQTQRLKAVVAEIVNPAQFGSQEAKGCADALLALNTIVNDVTKIAIGCLDMSGAFDKIRRADLWKYMIDVGVPKEYVNQLREGHKHTHLAAYFDGELGENVAISRGVFQGSPISPLLYLLIHNKLIQGFRTKCLEKNLGKDFELTKVRRKAEENNSAKYKHLLGESLGELDFFERGGGEKYVNCIGYVDDTTLLASTPEKLVEMIKLFNEECVLNGLKLNKEKTHISIKQGKAGVKQKQKDLMFQELGVKDSQIKSNFTFLGCELSVSVKSGTYTKQAIRDRLGKATKAYNKIKYLITRNSEMPRFMRMKMLRIFVETSLVYGLAAFSLSDDDVRELETKHSEWMQQTYTAGKNVNRARFYDPTLNAVHRTNAEVSSEMRVPSMSSIIEKERLRLLFSLAGVTNRGKKAVNYAALLLKFEIKEHYPNRNADKGEHRPVLNLLGTLDKLETAYKHVREPVVNLYEEELNDLNSLDTRYLLQEQEKVKLARKRKVTKEFNKKIRDKLNDMGYPAAKPSNISIFKKIMKEHIDMPNPTTMNHRVNFGCLTDLILRRKPTNQEVKDNTITFNGQTKINCPYCGKGPMIRLETHLSHQLTKCKQVRAQELECRVDEIELKKMSDLNEHAECMHKHIIEFKPAKICKEANLVAWQAAELGGTEVTFENHPDLFFCPFRGRDCNFPNKKKPWCVQCRLREGHEPVKNRNQKLNAKRYNNERKYYRAVYTHERIPLHESAKSDELGGKFCKFKSKKCNFPRCQTRAKFTRWCKRCEKLITEKGIKIITNDEVDD